MNKKCLMLINKFEDDPVLIHPTRFDQERFPKLQWEKMSRSIFLRTLRQSGVRSPGVIDKGKFVTGPHRRAQTKNAGVYSRGSTAGITNEPE